MGGALALQLLFDRGAAGGDGLGVRLGVEPLPDLGARTRALDEAALGVQPVARRTAGFGGDDFHPLAARERRVEAHDVAVHAPPPAALPQAPVHGLLAFAPRPPRP